MEGPDRTGTTGPSGSEAFAPSDGAVDATARMTKPAGDIAATDTDRDLAARIRMAVEGDPALGPGLDKSLHIKVDNGAVTLLGQVMNEQAKEQINAKVTALAGAHSVDNQLLIAQ
jgi:osmotically-inducible protein OsmY